MKMYVTKKEEHPCGDAVAWYAYFRETPNFQELLEAQKMCGAESSDIPQQFQDFVSDEAHLERWFLGGVV